jgi:aspartate racemase
MKTIGLMGGMSWESTVEYYRLINEAVRERLGGLHSAKCVFYFEELCRGVIRPESKAQAAGIMSRLVERGAEGVILGCTELGLLIKTEDCRAPLFDTTRLHALAAVDYALTPPARDPIPP